MARDDGGAAGTVVVAFVLGAITGAAVALLMAPASGEETRRMLAEKAREGREKAGEAAQKGRELWDRQRETLSTAFERGKEAYEQARGAAAGQALRGGAVNDWNQVFLGVIAVATALMAIVQIGAIVVLARVAGQVQGIVATIQTGHPAAHRARERHRGGSVQDGDAGHRAGPENRQAPDRPDPPRRRDLRRDPAGDHHAGPGGDGHHRGPQGGLRRPQGPGHERHARTAWRRRR